MPARLGTPIAARSRRDSSPVHVHARRRPQHTATHHPILMQPKHARRVAEVLIERARLCSAGTVTKYRAPAIERKRRGAFVLSRETQNFETDLTVRLLSIIIAFG